MDSVETVKEPGKKTKIPKEYPHVLLVKQGRYRFLAQTRGLEIRRACCSLVAMRGVGSGQETVPMIRSARRSDVQ